MSSEARGWIAAVIEFWFGELNPRDWWEKRMVVDQTIARRFAALHDRLSREASPYAYPTAEGMLAATIVLDQFSRHLYRGDPRSFASDPLALAIASRAVDEGYDRLLPPVRRRFLYMPFEHAEDRAAQARSVELLGTIGEEEKHYAELHKVIIDRFGRFPHRNAILGRTTTPEEAAFLKGPNSSF